MFGRLSHKLTLAMILVSSLTILLAGILIDRALDKQFVNFVDEAQEQLNMQVVEAVRILYEQRGLGANLEEQLRLLGAASNVEIVIESRENHHNMMMGRGMMGRGSMGMNRTSEQLTLPDGSETTIEIIPSLNFAKEVREQAFRKAINTSIFTAALLSLGSALVISLFFSWGLTKPLQQLIGMVQRVGQGQLAERTTPRGKDELSFLGKEFNQMAANLEQQERLRVKLTNDISHELRTPLASIQAYLEGMEDGVVEANPKNLSLISEEAKRLDTLLGSLQDLARLEKSSPRQTPVDVRHLTASIVRSLRILAEEKNLTLTLRDGQTPLFTLGDGEMLSTALRNVITNAIKYTPAGGQVIISLGSNGSEIIVQVADSGIGIEAQELPLIFERFYRADRSRSRDTGGTGIGLALTKEVVKGHGGRVEVQSELGLGSTFTIYLPMMQQGGNL